MFHKSIKPASSSSPNSNTCSGISRSPIPLAKIPSPATKLSENTINCWLIATTKSC
ncbi:hypothetical protein Hanom_Chr09g00812861 [Helianthus anomalus]